MRANTLEVNTRKRGHKFMTAKLRKALPALGTTKYQHDPIVRCSWFSNTSNRYWYAIEFDGIDRAFECSRTSIRTTPVGRSAPWS